MARGTLSKEKITAKILETFQDSFLYEKEIRVPMIENGETIQVKITLTAAKTNVESGQDTVLPGATAAAPSSMGTAVPDNFMNQPTPEEKESVAKLLQTLGITQ